MRFLGLILAATLLFSVSSIASAADEVVFSSEKTKRVLIEETDLQALSVKMKKDKLGLVLMFHAEDCDYCARLEAQQLQPMLRSGNYDDRVLIRKILIDGADDIVNFNGQTVSADQLATLYEASLTPTLVFLDASGEEIVERILGYTTPDFFGFYLDKAIDKLSDIVSSNVDK